MPSRGALGYVFATSDSLDALLAISSRSWPMRCASTKPSQHFTSTATRLAMRELRPGGRRGGELGGPSTASRSHGSISVVPQFVAVMDRDGFGILSRYESRRYNQPSATLRLIVADSLGISFRCRFLKQQSSALTGSRCRP